jgi:hypothetical protein
VKPNFIGIGAQKCASTWIYRILREHPQIGVSDEKEIDFFSYHYNAGYQWYERRFDHCAGKTAVGEISPSYFYEPAVPRRVADYLPSAKIIVSLRDPVERALSNHRFEVGLGRFNGSDLSFEAGLANNPCYEEQGRYATHLKRWMSCFPRDQILVLLSEEIALHPVRICAMVYDFLEVDSRYIPRGLIERPNTSHATRSGRLAEWKDRLYRGTRHPAARWIWRLGATVGLRALYRGINVVPSEKVIPAPKAETLARLRVRFAPEIIELSRILGRPLDHWL